MASTSDSMVTSATTIFSLKRLHKSVIRFQTTLVPSVWIPTTSCEVSVKEGKFTELKNELNFIKQNIDKVFSSSDDDSWKDVESILEDCDDLFETIHLILLSTRESITPKTHTQVTRNVETLNIESEFKLEKTKPPTFNGDYTDWQNFSDLFQAAVIQNPRISGAQKLVYLKNSLTGEAASIASSFPLNNLSFAEAWELVEKRFNKKREIVFSHLTKLFSLQSVPDTSKGILKLVDTINQCLRSLKILNVDVTHWDIFIVFWAHLKLDQETRRQWLLTTDDELPTLPPFMEFLEKRANALTPTSSSSSKGKSTTSSPTVHHTTTAQTKSKVACPQCNDKNHRIYKCPDFMKLLPHDRSAAAREKKLCLNCLSSSHQTRECKSDGVCAKCSKKHHTLLHFETHVPPLHPKPNGSNPGSSSKNSSPARTTPSASGSTTSSDVHVESHHSSSTTTTTKVVLMATVVARVIDRNGDRQLCRVFLDPGSESNFVSEAFSDRFNLKRQKSCVSVTGIGGSSGGSTKGVVKFDLHSRFDNFVFPVKALILPRLTGLLPRSNCEGSFPHLTGLSLADPTFNIPSSIDILLGAEATAQVLLPGLKIGPTGTPTAQDSRFGWFLTGTAPLSPGHTSTFCVTSCHASCDPNDQCLEASLERFWEFEDPSPPSPQLTADDQEAESHFQRTFSRDSTGRYEVSLPFKDSGDLGESMKKATSCFLSLERQLDKDPILKSAYHSQIQDYIARNWVEKIPDAELSPSLKVKVTSANGTQLSLSPFYLPHHVVVKPENTTTKFRIVFNASSKTSSGHSLNSILHSGPKIQTDLHPLLMRFRTHPITLCADIVKFYNQIKVSPSHCNFQRFLWRPDRGEPFTHLRFLRLTFGVTTAPFLAIRVLRQLGEECKEDFPLAYASIQDDFLVDNLLSGGNTTEEVLQLKSQLESVLTMGKFPLQKWASNCPEVLESLSPEERENYSMDIQVDESVKTIGLFWHPATDSFGVKITTPPSLSTFTKREILSHVARVFDPLQWLSPVTISAKILLQSLWKEKIGWDDPIPHHYVKKWLKYSSELELLRDFRIPRCLTFATSVPASTVTHDLIGFCDASNLAYGACVYLRSKCEDEVKILLIAAKTKVAPVGGETTPRLELCSAVLLSQLVNSVNTALTSTKIKISSVLCFTDSTGALGQLFSTEKQTVFVANRVRKIKNSPVTARWYHVPGELNPADCCSRGISPSNFLIHPLWLHGPDFLKAEDLPPQPYAENVATFIASLGAGATFASCGILRLIESTPSFTKMKRLLAYWIRLQNNHRTGAMPTSGPLTSVELEQAQLALIKEVQKACFSEEIDFCAKKKQIKGNIKFLSPFLDHNGILRVGGRLQMSALEFSSRHPVLLPKCHSKPTSTEDRIFSHFVLAVARHFHEANLHAGPKLLLSLIRSEFWIPRGADLCTRIFKSCVICFKQRPHHTTQIMAPLPTARVTPDLPFLKVGVDYAGPMKIALIPGRNPRLIDAYVCVFICMATKAIHLEYVGGLSTPDFIAALQRFCAIRNTPAEIYCDGGRNFLGAKNELEALQMLLSSPQHQHKVTLFATGEKINFYFSPPYGPHHGGLWEAAVKSMKLHLSRIVQGHHISLEEFVTLLARTSAALNSRPLTPVSNHPDDFLALTPFHFLSLRAPKYIPEEDLTSMKSHRSRWELIQQMSQHFFKNWSSDFLQSLQQKHKWLQVQPNLATGMMVLVQDVDSAFKHKRWTLGRIEETFPGPDGRVRTCDVRIPVDNSDKKGPNTKVYRRPITRLAPLPLDDDVTAAFSSIN